MNCRRKVADSEKTEEQQAQQSHEHDQEEDASSEEKGTTTFTSGGSRVQVEFEFHEPDEDDFHGVRDLLSSGSLSFAGLDFSGLANTIVGQVNIGTMVKSGNGEGLEGDDDHALCGMFTVLNVSQFSDQTWLQTLREVLLPKCHKFGGPEVETQVKRLFDGGQKARQVGLLINERFVNLPLDLIPVLHKAVLDDIEWSCTTPECPEEERPFYEFTHFLAATRCQSAPSIAPTPSTVLRPGESPLIFLRPEDAAYAREALFLFSFPLSGKESKRVKAEEPIQPCGKRKRTSVGDGGISSSSDTKRQQDRIAVFGITRKAFEKVVRGLRTSLAETE